MKKFIMFLGMLLSLGMFSACSSDDGISDFMDDKLSLFEDSLQSIPENDYIGYMHYDNRCGWYIIYSQPIDCVDTYYPLNLPDKFKEEEVKVLFSGKVVEMTDEERESLHFTLLGGHHYYFVYLTKIEKMEEEEIPY
jgi:hypothetical protein